MRPIPAAAMTLVPRWEGLMLEAYPDPVSGAEPYTIGYGHTDPGHVRLGDKISATQAKTLLKGDLAKAAALIEARIGAVVMDLTDNQYAALLSFVHNVGADPKWTIWKRLKARQFDQVPGELIKFVNAGGRKIQGLVNRRADEIRVWSQGEPGSEDIDLTSGALRGMNTPPTPTEAIPARKSATIWTTISAPVLGVVALVHEHVVASTRAVLEILTPDHVNQTLAAITPYAHKSAAVDGALQALAVLGAVLAAILVIRKHNQARS